MSQSGPSLLVAVILNMIWWMVMIAAIVVGAKHLEECPIQPNIPIYLTGIGVTSLLTLCASYSKACYEREDCCSCLSTICLVHFHLFTISWLIAGTVWIYPIYPPNYIPGAAYCHQITYDFAFGITTLMWVFIGFAFFWGLTLGLLSCCALALAKVNSIRSVGSIYGATDVGDV